MLAASGPNWPRSCAAFLWAGMSCSTAPQDDGIEVVRVLHSARDIESIFDDGGFDEN